MPSLTILQCKRNLDFQPLHPWPTALPAYCWEAELLCGFNLAEDHPVIELTGISGSWAQALKAIYPTLSFIELTRLDDLSSRLNPFSRLGGLMEAFGYRESEDLRGCGRAILMLSPQIQHFCAEKSFSPRDFASLRGCLSESTLFARVTQLWNGVIAGRASKQQAAKILEFLVDLNATEAIARKASESADAWLKRLEGARYPVATARDQLRKQTLAQVSWPMKTAVQFERNGDDTFLSLQLKAFSVRDLQTKIDQLNQTLTQTAQTLEDSWNPSLQIK